MDKIDSFLDSLKKSKFRAKFVLSEKDRNYIDTKGMDTIQSHAYDFVKQKFADPSRFIDGKQTAFRGHPVFIAQHATATCCRGCLEKWHKIEKTHILSSYEIDYIVSVIMRYLESQMAEKT